MKFLELSDRQLNRLSEERFYLGVLSMIMVVVATLMTVFVVDLHRNFLMIACDTAIYQNVLVNLLHGHWFRDTAYSGPNLLGQHSAFVLLLIAPLYALIPSVDMLFTLQIWVVYSAVLPLYLIAQEILRRPLTAFLIAALALASPLLFHMAAAPFHTESGILTAVLWSYFFYRRNHATGFWIGFGLAVCCGEQAALIYAALGIALFWMEDDVAWRKRYAQFALIGSGAWLIFSEGLLIPSMSRPGQLNIIGYHYSQWGIQSASGLALAIAHDPFQAIQFLLSPERWMHLAGLIGLPLLLAFLSPRSLILLAPFPFYFLMCDQEFFLYFHAYYYQFAFFAGYLGLIYFLTRWDVSTRLGVAVLVAVVAVNLLALFPVADFYAGFAMGRDEALSATLHAAFEKIPPDAAVYCQHRYSAYLSNRENMVMGDLRDENLDFKAMLDAKFGVTDVHPEQIDYIVCDLINDQCGWRQGGFNPDISKLRAANINRLIQSEQWQVFWNQSDVVILRRAAK